MNSTTTSGGRLYPLQCDVKEEQQVLNAFKWIKSNLGPIHILVNNAGCGAATDLVEGKTELWKNVFDTNVLALCVCTREAITDMRTNGVEGHVVHVNSVQGHRVTHAPSMNVYGGSKFAVTALTETLRQELVQLGSKIKVTVRTFRQVTVLTLLPTQNKRVIQLVKYLFVEELTALI